MNVHTERYLVQLRDILFWTVNPVLPVFISGTKKKLLP